MGAERVVELGQPQAAADAREARALVDVEHRVQPAEVERDGRLPAAALRRDPADDARAAAERDHGRARLGARAQHGLDLAVIDRRDDHVGGVLGGAARSASRSR